MTSSVHGTSTSAAEVTKISKQGIWLLLGGRERFLSFEDFPWFKEATVSEILKVELPAPHHLYWPDLDLDLAVESLEHPEKYPLVSRALVRSENRRQGAAGDSRH